MLWHSVNALGVCIFLLQRGNKQTLGVQRTLTFLAGISSVISKTRIYILLQVIVSSK